MFRNKTNEHARGREIFSGYMNKIYINEQMYTITKVKSCGKMIMNINELEGNIWTN